jgi:polysaccharide deacetylase family protein (PEP-CTERM system associated)
MSFENAEIILTVDVEDNFMLEELIRPSDWETYEKQAIENTRRVIALLKKHEAGATFFVLGKLAERHPIIVKEIVDGGYELASHGYAHKPVSEMTRDEFESDVRKSIEILEGIAQTEVVGFRARSFSVTSRNIWAFEVLKNLGLSYDSSCYDFEFEKIVAQEEGACKGLKEFPVMTRRFLGRRITMAGGVMFRLLPVPILQRAFKTPGEIESIMIYCHIWEFNRDQPARRIGVLQKIAQSSLTYTTESKLKHLAHNYKFISIRDSVMSG